MSFRQKVRSSYCPFDKMSVRLSVRRQNVRRQNVFRQSVFRQNVFSAKSPLVMLSVRQNVRSTKCPSAKCPSAKCLSAKCLSAKCPGTRQDERRKQVYTQTNYRTNYLFFAQGRPDRSSVAGINRTIAKQCC